MIIARQDQSADNDTQSNRHLSLKAARESLVLLKNSSHLLPLGTKYRTIAVIGPNADSVDPLLGNYNGTPSRPVTVLEGLRRRFTDSKILYAEGSSLTGPPWSTIAGKLLNNGSNRPGLAAEYFEGTQFKGTPVIRRTDANIDFFWGNGVSPQLKEDFSVRWTGTLTPPVTDDYQIGITSTDRFRFWLDDQLIGTSEASDTSKTRSKAVHLEAGHPYAVKIECSQPGVAGMVKLVWHAGSEKKDYGDAVKQADVIVAVMGLAGELEGEEMPIKIEGFAGGDRTITDLPRAQEELLKQLVASGKPVVVVLMNGSALSVNWADEHVPAILEAWYPGEEGGTAVAEALAGDFSPGGKLPLTFYRSIDQLPAFEDYNMKGRTYRYFTGEPLYPFGYGLSYTKFEYSNLSFDKRAIPADADLTVQVDVRNSGQAAGDEVVEVYVSRQGIEGAPLRALAGFDRLRLDAGASQRVEIRIPNRQLSTVDSEGTRRITPGKLEVWVGGGPASVREALPQPGGLSGWVEITGEAILPK